MPQAECKRGTLVPLILFPLSKLLNHWFSRMPRLERGQGGEAIMDSSLRWNDKGERGFWIPAPYRVRGMLSPVWWFLTFLHASYDKC